MRYDFTGWRGWPPLGSKTFKGYHPRVNWHFLPRRSYQGIRGQPSSHFPNDGGRWEGFQQRSNGMKNSPSFFRPSLTTSRNTGFTLDKTIYMTMQSTLTASWIIICRARKTT